MVRLTGLLALSLSALLMAACELPLEVEEAPRATSVQVEPAEAEGFAGDTVRFSATPVDADGEPVSGYQIGWSSDDTTIATVDDDGLATFGDSGSTTVTATASRSGDDTQVQGKGKAKSKGGKAESVTVSPSEATLEAGQTVQFKATVTDPDGNELEKSVQWTSLDPSVATVDEGGTVTGQSAGTTGIEARAGGARDTAAIEVTGGDDGSGGDASLVTDLEPAEYETDTLEAGIAVYIDRDYTVEGLPSAYQKWFYVRTANADKQSTEDSAVVFTLADTATVAVAYDERATTLPTWLQDWTATGDTLRTTNVDHPIFTRVFGPGETVLGGNMAGGAEGTDTHYLVFAAASDSTPDDGGDATQTGTLEVTAATTGEDPDADGYTVSVDGGSGQSIGIDGSVTFGDLAAEDHTIELSGVASNCSVSGSNPRTVTVPENDTVSTGFEVACEAVADADSVASVTVSPSSATLSTIGATQQFSAEATNADGTTLSGVAFSWTSSNTAVATVDSDGLATAQDEGEALIIATADGVADSASLSVDTTSSDDGSLDKSGTQWGPYVEWSLSNASYSGNPFDLVATVTFTHDASGEQQTTEMFYAGEDTWKFRFTGTRTGTWSFTTSSSDPELDGKSGTVDISLNSDPDVRGFLTTQGNKFARQLETGQLEPVVLSIFQDHNFDVFNEFGYGPGWFDENVLFYGDEAHLQAQMQKAFDHGANAVFLREITNEWFELGAYRHDEHDSVNPDLRTFEALETAITTVHEMGGILHLWAWGDESRAWTPVGVPGGINGEVDRRLQRYIAARLGPLPGWTMGYGFDLEEWVSHSEVDSWAEYLHQKMGWDHLLWARNREGPNLDVESRNGEGPSSFDEALANVNPDKPVLEEERFRYQRTFSDVTYTMDHTMDLMWWLAMADGSAGFWGTESGESDPPNPEWMRTHARFWQNHFRFGLAPANDLTDGYALATSDGTHYIFFKEGTSSIEMDLSGMSGSQSAVAVDTRGAYQEIDLGTLDPGTVTWNAPHSSDWAIAVGH